MSGKIQAVAEVYFGAQHLQTEEWARPLGEGVF